MGLSRVVDAANLYAAANIANNATEVGKAETASKKELKADYMKCPASNSQKLEAISSLAQAVIDKVNNSYVFKNEKGVLPVNNKGTVTLEQFAKTAKEYGVALEAAQKTDEFKQVKKTVKVFREVVLGHLKEGQTPEVIRKELENNGIKDEYTLSRPAYWQKKYC